MAAFLPRQELKTIVKTIEPSADAFSSLKNYAKPPNHKNGAVAGLHTQTGSKPFFPTKAELGFQLAKGGGFYHTHLIEFSEDDKFACKIAKTVHEASRDLL